MKKIALILVSASLLFFASCSTTSGLPKKNVPALYSNFMTMPIVKKIGNAVIIHDVNRQSFILFKGDELPMVEETKKWIDELLDEGEEDGKTPIVLLVGTDIDPLVSFSDAEMKAMSEADRSFVSKIQEFKLYTPTLFKKTYVEDMSGSELARYGLSVSQQAISPSSRTQGTQTQTKPRNPMSRSH